MFEIAAKDRVGMILAFQISMSEIGTHVHEE